MKKTKELKKNNSLIIYFFLIICISFIIWFYCEFAYFLFEFILNDPINQVCDPLYLRLRLSSIKLDKLR